MRARGPDAKPRSLSVFKKTKKRFRQPAVFRAVVARDGARTTGAVTMIDHGPAGRTSGVVFGTTGPQGGISADPGVQFAYWIRRTMRPIRVSPVTITDASGVAIATITVDPVTGKRTRTPVPQA